MNAFLGLHHIAEAGQLDSQTRERIALVVAESNSCEYCVSAHSAIGRKAGLSYAEIESARAGTSENTRAAAAVSFAQALKHHLGDVTQREIDGCARQDVATPKLRRSSLMWG